MPYGTLHPVDRNIVLRQPCAYGWQHASIWSKQTRKCAVPNAWSNSCACHWIWISAKAQCVPIRFARAMLWCCWNPHIIMFEQHAWLLHNRKEIHGASVVTSAIMVFVYHLKRSPILADGHFVVIFIIKFCLHFSHPQNPASSSVHFCIYRKRTAGDMKYKFSISRIDHRKFVCVCELWNEFSVLCETERPYVV